MMMFLCRVYISCCSFDVSL